MHKGICRCRFPFFSWNRFKWKENTSCFDDRYSKLIHVKAGLLLNIDRKISFSSINLDESSDDDRRENENYELICPITKPYFEQVITHLRYNFFVDEPTTQMLGMGNRGKAVPSMEEVCYEALCEGLSVMSLHLPTNQVAALSVNGIFQPTDMDKVRENQIDDEDIRMINNLFANIHKCLNLFEKYGVSKIFDIKAVSVDMDHRKRGLAKAVIEKSIEIAEGCGCKVVKTEGTSVFSQKAFATFGFETVWERNYTAFICENGDPVFQPIDPHKTLRIMTKIFNKDVNE